ncbi:hypothetical protein IWW50_005528 [Coemansia erecta]|nr:hypothetical protein IWW50_005528 [Coemansia erecta]
MSPPATAATAAAVSTADSPKPPTGYESYFRICRQTLKRGKGKASSSKKLEQALEKYAKLLNSASEQQDIDLAEARKTVAHKEQLLDEQELSLACCQSELADASGVIIRKIVDFMAASPKDASEFKLAHGDAVELMVVEKCVVNVGKKVSLAEAELSAAVKAFDAVQKRVAMSRMLIQSRAEIEASLDVDVTNPENN